MKLNLTPNKPWAEFELDNEYGREYGHSGIIGSDTTYRTYTESFHVEFDDVIRTVEEFRRFVRDCDHSATVWRERAELASKHNELLEKSRDEWKSRYFELAYTPATDASSEIHANLRTAQEAAARYKDDRDHWESEAHALEDQLAEKESLADYWETEAKRGDMLIKKLREVLDNA